MKRLLITLFLIAALPLAASAQSYTQPYQTVPKRVKTLDTVTGGDAIHRAHRNYNPRTNMIRVRPQTNPAARGMLRRPQAQPTPTPAPVSGN